MDAALSPSPARRGQGTVSDALATSEAVVASLSPTTAAIGGDAGRLIELRAARAVAWTAGPPPRAVPPPRNGWPDLFRTLIDC